MVTPSGGPSEGSLLQEYVGDRGDHRGEEMEEDSGSELSELEGSVVVGMEVDVRTGRPKFTRAATGAGRRVESTQEFFRRGNALSNSSRDEDNIFATPAKQAIRGALARSLLAAASSSPQQVRTALTPNSAKEFREGMEIEGGRELRMVGSKEAGGIDVAPDEWVEEMATQREDEIEGVVDPDRSTTPTPTPARWGSITPAPSVAHGMPRPVPVTPTKGSKRMAVGTLRRVSPCTWPAVRPMPAGVAAAFVLEQILAAIAGVERKMEKKVTALEAWMMEEMGVLAADENEKEVRAPARLLADVEERELRLAVKLFTMDTIEMELTQKGQWELKQWEDLARVLVEARRRDIREVRQAVDSLASEMAWEGRVHQGGPGAAETVSAWHPR